MAGEGSFRFPIGATDGHDGDDAFLIKLQLKELMGIVQVFTKDALNSQMHRTAFENEVIKGSRSKRKRYFKPKGIEFKSREVKREETYFGTSTRSHSACYNCGEDDHLVKSCPRPYSFSFMIFCKYCGKEGHRISSCPVMEEKDKEKGKTTKTSS